MNRRCIHCDAVLPARGDCAACAVSRSPEVLPGFLSRSLHLDRRSGERDAPPTAAGSLERIAPPPSIPPLAAPVGMTPRAERPEGTTVIPRRRTPISLEALAPPLPAQPAPPVAPRRDTPVLDLTGPFQPSESVTSRGFVASGPELAPQPRAAPPQHLSAPERRAPPAVGPDLAAQSHAAPSEHFCAPTPREPLAGNVTAFAHELVPAASPDAAGVDAASDARERIRARLAAHLAPAQGRLPDALEEPQGLRVETEDGSASPDDEAPLKARPAQLWRRALSSAVDGALVLSVGALYLGLAQAVAGTVRLEGLVLPGLALLALVATVYATVGSLWGGRTLGQQVAGIRLVDGSGRAPAPTVALARALLGTVSAGLLGAGFWLALVDRRGQTLHDKLTSTFIVQPI